MNPGPCTSRDFLLRPFDDMLVSLLLTWFIQCVLLNGEVLSADPILTGRILDVFVHLMYALGRSPDETSLICENGYVWRRNKAKHTFKRFFFVFLQGLLPQWQVDLPVFVDGQPQVVHFEFEDPNMDEDAFFTLSSAFCKEYLKVNHECTRCRVS